MLVNIWLGHQPKSVAPFPSNALEHMGKTLEVLVHDSPQRRQPDVQGPTWHVGPSASTTEGATHGRIPVGLNDAAMVELP